MDGIKLRLRRSHLILNDRPGALSEPLLALQILTAPASQPPQEHAFSKDQEYAQAPHRPVHSDRNCDDGGHGRNVCHVRDSGLEESGIHRLVRRIAPSLPRVGLTPS